MKIGHVYIEKFRKLKGIEIPIINPVLVGLRTSQSPQNYATL